MGDTQQLALGWIKFHLPLTFPVLRLHRYATYHSVMKYGVARSTAAVDPGLEAADMAAVDAASMS